MSAACNVIPAGYGLIARCGPGREGYPVVGFDLYAGEAIVLDPGTGRTRLVSELDQFIGIEPMP